MTQRLVNELSFCREAQRNRKMEANEEVLPWVILKMQSSSLPSQQQLPLKRSKSDFFPCGKMK